MNGKSIKTINILLFFIVLEAFLVGLYFYAQPLCEPCRAGLPCPPCISEGQKIIRLIILLLLIIFITIFFYTKKLMTKNVN
jgi:hypothetical protein